MGTVHVVLAESFEADFFTSQFALTNRKKGFVHDVHQGTANYVA